jgi:hypothetical protein
MITYQQIFEWLSAKQTTLWMDWDITDPEQRIRAAWWLYETINELQGTPARRTAQGYDVA